MTCNFSLWMVKWLPTIYHLSWIRVIILTMSWNVLLFACLYYQYFQDNARRVHDRGCGANTRFGKLSKLGLAPLLWCTIIGMLITYIHSVISGKLSSIFMFFSLSWSSVICYCLSPQDNIPWLWQHHLGCSHGQEFFLQLLGWSCSINVAGISKNLHSVDSYKKVKPDLRALIAS